MTQQGWFADIDPELEAVDYRWQPVLQLEIMCLSLPIWFSTKARCQEFIRERILGQPMMEE